jgi:hypothetical protein
VTDPILRLDPVRVSVEPGGQATLTLTVTNPGTIVEGYAVDVVSTIPVPWVEVTPSSLSVYPQQDATAVISFSPPSGPGAPGGSLPFGVRVWSEVEGGGSAVAEGDLDIGSVSGLQAKLTPIASTGRWSGRHTLKVTNWGNAPARLRLVPEDPDQALGFLISPDVVDVPLGGEAVARVKVRTRHPTLRGAAQRLPFQIAGEPDAPPGAAGPALPGSSAGRPVVDGAFNQKPILSRLVVAVAGLVLLALVAGLVYLLTRDDPPGGEEQVQQPDPPTGFEADPSVPGIVTLSWDLVADVEKYKLLMTAPVTDEAEIDSVVVGDRRESTIEVEAAAEFCYQLIAVREPAPDSEASEEKCVQTELPESQESVPTEDASIKPIPPTPSPTDEETPTDGETVSADPLRYIEVLQFFSEETAAEAARAAVADLGFDAKVLLSSEWVLTPETRFPGYVVYVDGETADEAKAACKEVEAAAPTLVPFGCVSPKTAEPKDGTPTPTS